MNVYLTARCCPECFVDLERMVFTITVHRYRYRENMFEAQFLDLGFLCGVCRTCDIVEFDDTRLLDKTPIEVHTWVIMNLDSLVEEWQNPDTIP